MSGDGPTEIDDETADTTKFYSDKDGLSRPHAPAAGYPVYAALVADLLQAFVNRMEPY